MFGGESSAGRARKRKNIIPLVAVCSEGHGKNGVSRGSDGRGDARRDAREPMLVRRARPASERPNASTNRGARTRATADAPDSRNHRPAKP